MRSNAALRTHRYDQAPALLLRCNGLVREVAWWAPGRGSLDGMQGVRGSNPLSSTTTTPQVSVTAWPSPHHPLSQRRPGGAALGPRAPRALGPGLVNGGQDPSLHLGCQMPVDGPDGAPTSLRAAGSGGPVAISSSITRTGMAASSSQVAKVSCMWPATDVGMVTIADRDLVVVRDRTVVCRAAKTAERGAPRSPAPHSEASAHLNNPCGENI
jgi:hypothetical protein